MNSIIFHLFVYIHNDSFQKWTIKKRFYHLSFIRRQMKYDAILAEVHLLLYQKKKCYLFY